ncbi:MAG: ATP-binding cassette domain-containing protein [Anaerolineales bacterium]|nr:ATP-binding cassette domain-containing protein [Anaerolineales bacterium]
MTDPSPLILETRHLYKSFGSLEVLRDINLHVHKGDIYVLLGPNGAGKTTTLGLITQLIRPTKGEVVFAGRPGEMAGFIGTPPVYPHLSARDNLRLSFLMRRQPVDLARIDRTLATVGLASARDRRAGEFSTGMRQRLGLARALLFEPHLIILDEPTSGMDPEGIVEVREMIRDLNRQRGITWLISSHMLAEVEQIATRVSILMNGAQRIEATMDSLRENKNVFALDTPEPERARAALPAGVTLLEAEGTRLLVRLDDNLGPAELNRHLVEGGVPVTGLGRVANRLEAMYFQICYGVSGGWS